MTKLNLWVSTYFEINIACMYDVGVDACFVSLIVLKLHQELLKKI